MSILNKFRPTNPTEELLFKALDADENTDTETIIQLLEAALQSVSDKMPKRVSKMLFPATILLADQYIEVNNLQKARETFKSALSLAKTDMDKMHVHEALGKLEYLLSDYEKSASHYLKSLHYASKHTPENAMKTVHSHLLHQLGHVLLDNHRTITEEQKKQADEYQKYLLNQPNAYNLTKLNFYRDIGMDWWKEFHLFNN